MHYKRFWRNGNPLVIKRYQKSNRSTNPVYAVYCSMKGRCLNPNNRNYNRYGGRGISIDKRWLGVGGFDNFLNDMGDRPNGMTLERVNNDGNYEPQNCVWATRTQQSDNRSVTRYITFHGERKPVNEYARIFSIDSKLVKRRLDDGWTIKRALTSPRLTHKKVDCGEIQS